MSKGELMTTFSIQRDGQLDLQFRGKILGRPINRQAMRLTCYETVGGRYVAAVEWQGQHRAYTASSIVDLLYFLRLLGLLNTDAACAVDLAKEALAASRIVAVEEVD